MAASFQGFRSLIENSPDAISLVDTQGEILYGSASTAKIFGYQPEELVGRNCLDLIHPEDRDHSTRALQEVLAEPPRPLQWDVRVRCKDGTYSWVESTVSNLLLELEVQAIVMQQRDISARKAVEVERQRHAEELVRSNLRLVEFAHHAAHDLREPLLAISLYTKSLLGKTELDADDREMAHAVVESAARMSSLVEGLLSFARTGIHEPPQSVHLLHAVWQATRNLVLATRRGGAKVTVDWLPVVRGNEINFVRLFQNLLGNAVKYKGEHPVEIHVTATQRGPDWAVRIQDNGIGIAEDDQARVFMPFVRLANRDIPGSGLGLAVCKKIVEELGGTIWVESKLGTGSTFCFTVTAVEDEPHSFRRWH